MELNKKQEARNKYQFEEIKTSRCGQTAIFDYFLPLKNPTITRSYPQKRVVIHTITVLIHRKRAYC